MGDTEENASIAEVFDFKGKTKNKKKGKKVTEEAVANNGGDAIAVRISPFDYSVENFFRDMYTIACLCEKERDDAAIDQSEIQAMSSSVTFLRYK